MNKDYTLIKKCKFTLFLEILQDFINFLNKKIQNFSPISELRQVVISFSTTKDYSIIANSLTVAMIESIFGKKRSRAICRIIGRDLIVEGELNPIENTPRII